MASAPAQQFDLIVIGGGPVGICGANTAALFGQRVALENFQDFKEGDIIEFYRRERQA